jgi:hypothetical protein
MASVYGDINSLIYCRYKRPTRMGSFSFLLFLPLTRRTFRSCSLTPASMNEPRGFDNRLEIRYVARFTTTSRSFQKHRPRLTLSTSSTANSSRRSKSGQRTNNNPTRWARSIPHAFNWIKPGDLPVTFATCGLGLVVRKRF